MKVPHSSTCAAGFLLGCWLAIVLPDWAGFFAGVAVIIISAPMLAADLWPKTQDDIFAEEHRVDRRHPSQFEEDL